MARDLNQVIIIGRLVRDPEIKYTTTGTPITKFSIANNVSFTQGNDKKEYVNYFDITVWGNQAVNCEKYLKKGAQVAVEGHLRQNRWVDQASGKTQSKVEVTANSVQFLSPTGSGTGGGQPNTNYSNNPNTNTNNNFNQGMNNQNNTTTNNNNTNKGFIPDPWNDNSGSGGDFVEDAYPGPSDDDIPF